MEQKPVIIQPPWTAKQGYVRSWLGGRFARWQQVRLSKEQTVVEVMMHAFWELLQNGYSLKMLRTVVFFPNMSDGQLSFRCEAAQKPP